MRRVHNPPLALYAVLALVGGWLGFLSQAANRLVSGHERALWDAAPGWIAAVLVAIPLLLGVLAFQPFSRRTALAGLALSAAALLLLPLAAGQGAALLAAHAPPAARMLLGSGFWLMLFAFALATVDALPRVGASMIVRGLLALFLVACVAAMAWAGVFTQLSLAREWATHRAEFGTALQRHLVLVACTLLIALATGVPLGITVQRRTRLRAPLFAVLNVVQTIPSVALFGLLITPLSAIGLSGIGFVPALFALVLYALLPVVRNTVSGLDGVDAATLEAASGMGMAPGQILLRVELPLAAPALFAGLRIVTVQAIGLAVVAALIGAGGLGDFVFQGLGQYAVDLVLLGALPAIALALAADFILQLVSQPFRQRLA